jgi:hypothetical protein
MGGRVVPELGDAAMLCQYYLDDGPLDAAPAAVDEANDVEVCGSGRIEVGVDDRRDIASRERMQVKLAFDRNTDRIAHRRGLRAP